MGEMVGMEKGEDGMDLVGMRRNCELQGVRVYVRLPV